MMKRRSKSLPVSSSRRKSPDPHQSPNPIEASVSDACVVSQVADKCVCGCDGNDCLLSFHQECLDAELSSSEEEGPYCPYCPYCCINNLVVKNYASGDECNAYTDTDTDNECYYTGELKARDELESSDNDDVNECSGDTTEIISDWELQGDEDDACSSKLHVHKDQRRWTLEEEMLKILGARDKAVVGPEIGDPNLSGDDDNEYSLDTIEIGSDQKLKGDGDDACSSKRVQVHVEKNPDQSNITSVEAFDDETSQNQSRGSRCGAREKGHGTGKENEQVQPNENRSQRGKIALEAIVSEVSSNVPTGEDITQVPKSRTGRDISFFFDKNRRRRILWTPEEVEMLMVGVEEVAPEVKQNRPWKKILEKGKNVFHETRNPESLRGKWQNMISASKSDKEKNKMAV